MWLGHMTCSGQYIYIFVGANFCLLFLASCHHVYHIRGLLSSHMRFVVTTYEVCRHHILCPSNQHAHPPHTRLDRIVPVAKIQGKARMVHRVGRHANAMGSSGMSGWEAHMLLALTMW